MTVDRAQWTSIATQFADCTYEQVFEYACAAAATIGGTALFLEVGQTAAELVLLAFA